MKISAILFWVISLFFGIAAIWYGFWTFYEYGAHPDVYSQEGGPEWVGTIALSLTSVFGALVGWYLQKSYNAQGGELPEDRGDADIDDGDPELGFFSPWSWWPISLAFGVGLIFLGIAVGFWIVLVGIPVLIVALMGWQFEYYRGHFGR